MLFLVVQIGITLKLLNKLFLFPLSLLDFRILLYPIALLPMRKLGDLVRTVHLRIRSILVTTH